LDRFLDPLTEALTPESASALLNLRADPDLEARIDELRGKANEGTLTPAEDAEYKEIVEAIDIVSIMQAKSCRVGLRNWTSESGGSSARGRPTPANIAAFSNWQRRSSHSRWNTSCRATTL